MTASARTPPLLASVPSLSAGERLCELFRSASLPRASPLSKGAAAQVGPAASLVKGPGTSHPLDLCRRTPPGRADAEAAPLG
ncbi:MAG TPA: hypothetical protein VFG53_18360 [Anaeromyxobacter sp.]|nr:hypothetical protein [Anaeromyxobacter sp.]